MKPQHVVGLGVSQVVQLEPIPTYELIQMPISCVFLFFNVRDPLGGRIEDDFLDKHNLQEHLP